MLDGLRTRIAAAIDQEYNAQAIGHTYEVCLHAADAVIRELGLEPQVHYDPDCEFYRYVTDWIDPRHRMDSR